MQFNTIVSRTVWVSLNKRIIHDVNRRFIKQAFQKVSSSPIPLKGAVKIDPNEHIFAHSGYVDGLQDHRVFQVKTTYDIINRSVELYGNRPMFSFRHNSREPFQSYTYSEVYKMIHEIGSGLVHMGMKKSNETFIGIYASANVHYALFLYAAWPFSFVPVGIYDSLGIDAVRYIVKHADLEIIFADNLQRVTNLIEHQSLNSALKTIVSLIEPSSAIIAMAKSQDIRIITYDELRRTGRTYPTEPLPPQPTDTALILYTSGSTGDPKGCIITHDSLICSSIGITMAVELTSLANEEIPRVLNFMPMAHMLGCGTSVIFTFLGGEVGFWQGSVDKLMEDFRDFKPNILTMVLRLLNKLHDKVMSETQKKGFIAQSLMQMAIRAKSSRIANGDFAQNTLWDRLIFEKVRAAFGGRVKRVFSASAPLSTDVAQFSRAIFSCFFIEGYGQTECVAGTWQTVDDQRSGEIGVPTPVNHIKLIDVPEKNYFARDNVGEICIRSRAVFKGYLKDSIKTRETLTEDGWLLTGDIGRWTEHNTLKIIDRKNNIYKLSHGEYIAPEKIENIYVRSPFIAQVYVYGDSQRDALVAIVFLEDEAVKKWMMENRKTNVSTIVSEQNYELREAVLKDMIKYGKSQGLMSYEQVKTIVFITEQFTIENGLLTPTFKARRQAVEKKYQHLFQDLYKQLQR